MTVYFIVKSDFLVELNFLALAGAQAFQIYVRSIDLQEKALLNPKLTRVIKYQYNGNSKGHRIF